MDKGKERIEKEIEQDRQLTHAVLCTDAPLLNPRYAAEKISEEMNGLNERAMRAGMVILNTSVLQSSYYNPAQESGRVVVTIIAQWMERSALEKMQLQQRLMGQQNGGPR